MKNYLPFFSFLSLFKTYHTPPGPVQWTYPLLKVGPLLRTSVVLTVVATLIFQHGNAQNGIFYTAEELAVWKQRAQNGPFKSAGDAFENSPDDWDRMLADAETFMRSDRHNILWKGTGKRAEDQPNGRAIDRAYTRMMTAAFVDLIRGSNTYKPYVKQALLIQADEPGTDFSNSQLYPLDDFEGNTDGVWMYAEWQMKFLLAYDYLGKDYFSPDEQHILEKWFRDGAHWHERLANEKSLDNLYVKRGVAPEDYEFNPKHPTWRKPSAYSIYRGGPKAYSAGNWHNNRRAGQINFVTKVGVLLNDESMKRHGAVAVKEYIAFRWYPDGYFMELHRSTPGRPQGGLGYGPNTLAHYVEIAHTLKMDGYENLFEFSTKVSINPDDGSLIQGTVEKSLKWAILQFRKNFMESGSKKIYPYGSEGTSPDILMHYCLAPANSQTARHRTHISLASSMANRHYQNPEIRAIYFPPSGNLCGFPSNPTSQGAFTDWTGVGGCFPGYMLLYADVQ